MTTTSSPFQAAIDEIRKHKGQNAAAWAGVPDQAYCAAMATTAFKKAGLGPLFDRCENVNYVPTLFAFGEKKGLTSSTRDSVPQEGAFVSSGDEGHLMTVTKVLPGGKEVMVIAGNEGVDHIVKERKVSVASLDPQFFDPKKMEQRLHDKGVPMPPPGSPSIGALASEMTTPDANGKPPSLTDIFNQHQNEKEQPNSMMMQFIVAILLMLSGKSDLIPSQDTYKQNANAGRDVLQQVDAGRSSQPQQAVASTQVKDAAPLTPTATPNVSTALSRIPQIS